MEKSIKALRQVGYTPLSDALDFTLAELKKLPKVKKDENSVTIFVFFSLLKNLAKIAGLGGQWKPIPAI